MAGSDVLTQSANQFRELPRGRQIALALTALGSLAFGLWIAFGAGGPHYRVLYRGLEEAEAARVVDALAGERISYRLEEGGTAVHVSAGDVHEARIRLAGRGLPGGAGAGFELFDEPRFGTTEFVHRVNYRRALQGELARSVEQLDAVERARIQIAIPDPSPFVGERERTPSASVVIRLAPGRDLGNDRVRGIVHLVSSSVEALEPERVSVVDEAGRLLAPEGDATVGGTAPSARQRYQNALEGELSRRVEAILGRTVGAERVVARVRADLEWTQTEQTEERFDPNSQIERSEQRNTETESEAGAGGGGGGGRPGVASNVPDAGGGAGGAAGNNSNRTSETISYELSKTVRHSVEPLGGIKRLTLAVLLDGQPNAEGEFTPWDEDAIQEFGELARHAVGFSEERGDRITVTNAPFRSFSADEVSGGFNIPQGVAGIAQHAIRVLGLLIAVILFSKMVVKPLTEVLRSPGDGVSKRIAELEARLVATGAIADGDEGAGDSLAGLAPGSPAVGVVRQTDQSLQAIRSWLRET